MIYFPYFQIYPAHYRSLKMQTEFVSVYHLCNGLYKIIESLLHPCYNPIPIGLEASSALSPHSI